MQLFSLLIPGSSLQPSNSDKMGPVLVELKILHSKLGKPIQHHTGCEIILITKNLSTAIIISFLKKKRRITPKVCTPGSSNS